MRKHFGTSIPIKFSKVLGHSICSILSIPFLQLFVPFEYEFSSLIPCLRTKTKPIAKFEDSAVSYGGSFSVSQLFHYSLIYIPHKCSMRQIRTQKRYISKTFLLQKRSVEGTRDPCIQRRSLRYDILFILRYHSKFGILRVFKTFC